MKRNYHKLDTTKGNILIAEQIRAAVDNINNLTPQADPKYVLFIKPDNTITHNVDEATSDHLRVSVVKATDGKLYAMYQQLGEGAQGKVKLMQCLHPNADGEYEWIPVKITATTEAEQTKRSSHPIYSAINKAEHTLTEKFGYLQGTQQRVSHTTKHGLYQQIRSRKKYTFMSYIPGKDCLSIFIDEKTNTQLFVSQAQKALTCINMCKELQRAHNFGFIQRDIKLENFMQDPSTLDVHLIDFGLSKAIDDSRQHILLGNIGYLPPEVTHEYHYSPASDTYSLALVFNVIFKRHNETNYLPKPQQDILDIMLHELIISMTHRDYTRRLTINSSLPKLYEILLATYHKDYFTTNQHHEHQYIIINSFVHYALEHLRYELRSAIEHAKDKQKNILEMILTLAENLDENSTINNLKIFHEELRAIITDNTELFKGTKFTAALTKLNHFISQFKDILEDKIALNHAIEAKTIKPPTSSVIAKKVTNEITPDDLHLLAKNFSSTLNALHSTRKRILHSTSLVFKFKEIASHRKEMIHELTKALSSLSNNILSSRSFSINAAAIEIFNAKLAELKLLHPTCFNAKHQIASIMDTFNTKLTAITKPYLLTTRLSGDKK